MKPLDLKIKDYLIEEYLKKNRKSENIAKELHLSKEAIQYRLRHFGIRRNRKYQTYRSKRLKNYDWLFKKYYEEGKSQAEIGKILKFPRFVIASQLKKLKIPKHKEPLYINGIWLKRKYLKEKKSGKIIAKICNVSSSTISAWLKKFNLQGKQQKRIKYTDHGYIKIRKYGHPNANKYGWIFEHRYKMSKHLKRSLKSDEIIHHLNGNRMNNKLSNLSLHTPKSHKKWEHYFLNWIIKKYPRLLKQFNKIYQKNGKNKLL